MIRRAFLGLVTAILPVSRALAAPASKAPCLKADPRKACAYCKLEVAPGEGFETDGFVGFVSDTTHQTTFRLASQAWRLDGQRCTKRLKKFHFACLRDHMHDVMRRCEEARRSVTIATESAPISMNELRRRVAR